MPDLDPTIVWESPKAAEIAALDVHYVVEYTHAGRPRHSEWRIWDGYDKLEDAIVTAESLLSPTAQMIDTHTEEPITVDATRVRRHFW